MTYKAHPERPVLRYVLFSLAPITKATNMPPGRPAEHRDGRYLIIVRDLRPHRIAQKPTKIRFPKAGDRWVDEVIAAKLGQEHGNFEVGRFDKIIRVQAANVSTPGNSDAEVAIIADEMRLGAIDEACLRQTLSSQISENV